jgi:hypothetical protein
LACLLCVSNGITTDDAADDGVRRIEDTAPHSVRWSSGSADKRRAGRHEKKAKPGDLRKIPAVALPLVATSAAEAPIHRHPFHAFERHSSVNLNRLAGQSNKPLVWFASCAADGTYASPNGWREALRQIDVR